MSVIGDNVRCLFCDIYSTHKLNGYDAVAWDLQMDRGTIDPSPFEFLTERYIAAWDAAWRMMKTFLVLLPSQDFKVSVVGGAW